MVMNDQYETGNSSVEISDGAKGSTVKVKIYARPVPTPDAIGEAYLRLKAFGLPEEARADLVTLGEYVAQLQAQITDNDAAQGEANRLHLKAAAQVEINGGIIVYDPDKLLMAAWVEMERHDAENA